jgi:hypothetical protein
MSGPVYANVPALFQCLRPTSFIAANGTTAKVLVEPLAAANAVAPAPAYVGGSTVIDLTAASSDAASKDLLIYEGVVTTTQDATNTGAMTTTTSTIPRTSGSFIVDGWKVGDTGMVFAPEGVAANAGVDGIPFIVTAVAALTLTLNGTPIAALTLAAASRVVRIGQSFRATIAANSGNTSGSVPSVNLIGNAQDGSILRTEHKLGPNDLLIAAMQAAVSALPATVSITGQLARY